MKIKYSTLIVKDMNESVKFYTENLGFAIDSEYHLPHATIFLLKGEGETMVELIEDKEGEIGLFSIGMEVEDIDETVENLKNNGIEFIIGPTEISVGKMALFKDPNDVNIVIIKHDK